MSLNCNEINLILNELNLEGAFIQEIVQPGYDTMAFYTYREGCAKTVVVCTAQNSVRMNETRRKITKNDKPLRFMEFCRARIKGCRINSIEQIGVERIVKLELSRTVTIKDKPNEKTNQIKLASTAFNLSNTAVSNSKIKEEEIHENYILYIKLWNNAANIILCDENNVILEPMFRRPERNEIKDAVYKPPVINEEKIAEAADRFPVREWLDGGVAGVSPAEGVTEDSEAGCSQGKTFPSFNAYIDYWYSEHADNLSRESLLEKAEKWYNTNRSKREAALQNLEQKLEEFKNADQLKHQGDLILSYGYKIDGTSKFLECEDYETGKTVRLMIDPEKSAQENAAVYYKNYKKAQSGSEELVHDIEIAKSQIKKLDDLYAEIKNEQNPVKIEQLLRRDTAPKQQQKKTHPGLDYTVNGWYILVGRDANENDELLRHYVRGDDLWLHVRDFPGGYVFVKARKGKTVPLEILLDAGNLAVYYSKARKNTKVDLYYTHVKYLRRAKNGPKGLVIPTQEKNLCITPDKAILSRLDSLQKMGDL
ncbi:MAG: NFACT RNA binding domain-containing protein [Spirochaetia bacterium]|nr:NFACT RNA binding domain-containing protein [Spirochaetia bacterium]